MKTPVPYHQSLTFKTELLFANGYDDITHLWYLIFSLVPRTTLQHVTGNGVSIPHYHWTSTSCFALRGAEPTCSLRRTAHILFQLQAAKGARGGHSLSLVVVDSDLTLTSSLKGRDKLSSRHITSLRSNHTSQTCNNHRSPTGNPGRLRSPQAEVSSQQAPQYSESFSIQQETRF